MLDGGSTGPGPQTHLVAELQRTLLDAQRGHHETAKRWEKASWIAALILCGVGAASTAMHEPGEGVAGTMLEADARADFGYGILGLGFIVGVWAFTRSSARRRSGDDLEEAELNSRIEAIATASNERDTARATVMIAQRRLFALKARRARTRWFLHLAAAVGATFLVVATLPFLLATPDAGDVLFGRADAWVMLVYVVMCAGWAWSRWARLRYLTEEIRAAELEVELSRYPLDPTAWRAANLLRNNEYELKRYYALNLRQNAWLLLVGVVCILAGLGLVALVLDRVERFDADGEKILAGVLGALGSFLAGYVAKLLLEMNAKASANLQTFYAGLVRSNELFLANAINAGVDDDALRRQTASRLALAMVRNGGAEGESAQSEATPA